MLARSHPGILGQANSAITHVGRLPINRLTPWIGSNHTSPTTSVSYTSTRNLITCRHHSTIHAGFRTEPIGGCLGFKARAPDRYRQTTGVPDGCPQTLPGQSTCRDATSSSPSVQRPVHSAGIVSPTAADHRRPGCSPSRPTPRFDVVLHAELALAAHPRRVVYLSPAAAYPRHFVLDRSVFLLCCTVLRATAREPRHHGQPAAATTHQGAAWHAFYRGFHSY